MKTPDFDMKPFLLIALLVLQLASLPAIGAEGGVFSNTVARSSLPQGSGFAAAFEADYRIETNSAVIFADDFESGELGAHWDEQSPAKEKALSFASPKDEICGRRCLRVEARLGENHGGGLTKWFQPAE